jgi:flagellar protein FliO/FliZ
MIWIVTTLLLCAAMIIGGLAIRSYLTGQPLTGNLFAPKPERRLGVLEQANVDGRRRLILIKRDNVEHLIMTGGPVDVLIESGIGATPQRSRPALATETEPAVFSRQPRALGQAAGE